MQIALDTGDGRRGDADEFGEFALADSQLLAYRA
jgi:hypothetical protein